MYENGEVVAHVGVMELAVTLDGRARTLAVYMQCARTPRIAVAGCSARR